MHLLRTGFRRVVMIVLLLAAVPVAGRAGPPPIDAFLTAGDVDAIPVGGGAPAPPIEAFLKNAGVDAIALSPDGTYAAAVLHTNENRNWRVLIIYDVTSAGLKLRKAIRLEYTVVQGLVWANNARVLIALQPYDPKTGSIVTIDRRGIRWFPRQVISLDANLENRVVLLEGERDFKFSLDKASVLNWLPSDPQHILMVVYDSSGRKGLNVYKVNVYDGTSRLMERGRSDTVGWMVDSKSNIRLRIDERHGSTIFMARNSSGQDWFEIARFGPRETPNIEPVAFSDDPNILYVKAVHNNDRLAIFEYRMRERALGRLVFAHPRVDVSGGLFAQPGNRLVGFRYVVHKPRGEYLDAQYKDFDLMLEKSFGAENFSRPIDATRDGRLMVIAVDGPRDPGSYYLYDRAANTARLIGVQSTQLDPSRMGPMRQVVYTSRDGVEIDAYFTTPPGNPARPPLVVMPHGGPEVRDYMEWNSMVQFFATRGYAVLRPNFRGSGGFGRKFAGAGYGQWGLKMQDDITDGVRHVVSQGLVDPARICIVGGSYGGYAALAGAAFTPELYKCAVSINGISDLYELMLWEKARKKEFGYWKKSIGDPDDRQDEVRMKNRSPLRFIDRIRAPILLVVGRNDKTVPPDQGLKMAAALKKAGRQHRLVEFKDEGHTISTFENQKRLYAELEAFLYRHIGRTDQMVAVGPESTPDSAVAWRRPILSPVILSSEDGVNRLSDHGLLEAGMKRPCSRNLPCDSR